MNGLSRRGLMAGTVGAGLIAGAVRAEPDAHPEAGRTLTRIAFGSCAKSDKPQPIWDAVLATQPDLFIFLGDNVYLDTRDPAVMRRKYAELAAQPGFQRLKATVPILAIWDDHDYGENDAGADYPMKEESRRLFLDFFGEPADSPRRTRDGIYTAHVFGPAGRQVQVILPDLRWNRTPLMSLELGDQDYDAWIEKRAESGEPTPGPYARNPEIGATQLGETQWRWLEAQLGVQADVRILASSLQVLADFAGWEGWINFAHDHQRLIAAIRDKRANGLICLSGDTHYGEISRLDVNTPYPLWDITSSGLTEVWPVTPPNALRVGSVFRDQNFGLLTIDWEGTSPTVLAQVRDVNGVVRLEQPIRIGDLVV
ncbi:alkaline phosphatase D family protein [Brevundimonas variabilis]|uniref:Alkaline phosphatase D n=1 Tax=Brevundimonas variabilis TaxID=74312 RepID=A0A7W9CHK4_9CAUL|nr:alkaline phosphatase D family protein [Brevundimonas variabilis]MBB5745744.1 alkaline phosphatase D [Brevundimonas variabilis]